jgi:Protein kinase domain/FHA domain
LEPLIVRVEDSENGTAVERAFHRSPVRIGRSVHNDLCLPQRFVSAWHGRIDFDARGVRYTDLGSTNGTLLNGFLVESRATVPLERGAEVAIGFLRFTIRFTLLEEISPGEGPPEAKAVPEPLLAPGGITAMMKKLAAAPSDDFERAWRRVLVPGALIGRFELHREVGRGSFGVVFEAKDRQLGRLVAFKAVKPGRESQVMFREEMLQKEAEAAAQLNHPNIVSLYDVGTCESGPYLILELLRGENLRDRMRRGRMPLPESLEIGIEIAWALDHAHAKGVVHRDLKPANVFLCADGPVKVLDFGIAHVFGAGSRHAVGTPAYMAPEQWRDAPQDARTDVFGAAATLAEMVTGRLPYRVTENWSAVLDPGARPHLDAPGAPPQLTALLRRGLSANVEARPRDGHAWLAALLEIHELLDKAQPVETVARPGERSGARANTGEGERGELPALRARTVVFVSAAVVTIAAMGALAYLLLN